MNLFFPFFLVLLTASIVSPAALAINNHGASNREPSFTEIMHVALKNEDLTHISAGQWQKKIKWAPLLPQLYIGFDQNLKKTSSLSITDNISVTNAGVTVGPADNDWDETLNDSQVLRVRAVWDLDELVFHPASLQIAREFRETTKLRLQWMDEIYEIYVKRRGYLYEYFNQGSKVKKSLLREKINLLTAKLDFLTGGVFRNEWWQE